MRYIDKVRIKTIAIIVEAACVSTYTVRRLGGGG